MATTRWLFADQLGPHFLDDVPGAPVLLIESTAALGRRTYHRQKLHYLLSALRHRVEELGDRATFLQVRTYREALDKLGRPVQVHEPTSWAAQHFVERLHEAGTVEEMLVSPGWATTRTDFANWAGDRRALRMDDFYRHQRKRLGLLMDGEQPVGGRWSLDAENREPPPKRATTLGVPPPYQPQEDEIDDQVRADLDRWEADGTIRTVGADGPRHFAVTRAEAVAALHRFIEHRLPAFGPHEDAMLAGDWTMAHSLLSVPLNLGLLHPVEVAEAAEQAYLDGHAPLASAEGFIRQVVGWREYIHQVYWHFGPDYRSRNYLAAHTPLPDWFSELRADQVDAACLSDVLGGVRDRGWVHHIPRLMVLGNWALQRGYDPDELTEWYRSVFVDGYDWVMPPNVVGMSQHADGGAMATKPYASGGAYINTMSDYCGGCRYDPKKRVGDDACPFTAGYWAFLDRNSVRLEDNPRMRRPLLGRQRLRDLDALLEQEAARGNDPP
ncbi:MAG TPA: cryptochrome/photolyase family protein [Nocardioidaceae bacterium]|nr:cryptochrome/photolyase family protein [Nocardioidaceae bacterium]